jgi:hypothetical protein
MSGIDDIVSNLKNGVVALGSIAQTLSNAFPQTFGSFTLSNATTTVVAQTAIIAVAFPIFEPTNATAALTLRTQGLYVSSVTPGVGFAVSTQTGLAVGTETFKYRL